MDITIELDTYDCDDPHLRNLDDASVAQAVGLLLDALIAINMTWLRRNRWRKSVYRSGVGYCCVGGPERFADIGRVIERGGGDCAELASWRIAELRLTGEQATYGLEISRDDNSTVYHVVVVRGDGRIEDPSKRLGME